MRKFLLLASACLFLAGAALAANTVLTYKSGFGQQVVSASGVHLNNIFVSASAGGATLNIYDAATVADATVGNLRLSIPLADFSSIDVTSALPLVPVNANFNNGVVVDTGAATVTASYNVSSY